MPRDRLVRAGLALVIAVASVGAIGVARSIGVASRRLASAPGLVTVDDSAALLRALDERAGHGRVLVYASRFLHFMPVDLGSELLRSADTAPVDAADLRARYPGWLDHTSFLWLAMHAGTAREIVHLLPAEEYAARVAATRGMAGVTVGDAAMYTHELGSRRTVVTRLPRIDEPVVLAVDAAYFRGGDLGQLTDALRAADLRADLVLVNLARDNPDVDDGARRAAEQAVSALQERLP